MRLFVALVIVLLIISGIIAGCDSNRFIVRKYHFYNDKVKNTFRFVFVSDLHNKSYGKGNVKLLEAIDRLNPEAVLCAGDMLIANPGKSFQTASGFLAALAEKYPIYYGYGNHEYRLKLYPKTYGDMSEKYEKELKKAGIVPLENEKRNIYDKNIIIYGLEIGKEYYKRFHKRKMEPEYISSLLGPIDRQSCTILIGHNPDYFEQYAEYGADFVLSGHVHGGVARIPFLGGLISPSLHFFPKYDGGVFKRNGNHDSNTTMILSRGLGTHTIPIRFLNPGELIEITISPKESGK